MAIKFVKLANDPCFGKKFEQHCQCGECWIKNSCFMRFRNNKK